MKQDEFERLNKIVAEMERSVECREDEQMFEAIRAGIGILERFVVAIERIAAQGEPQTAYVAVQPVEVRLAGST